MGNEHTKKVWSFNNGKIEVVLNNKAKAYSKFVDKTNYIILNIADSYFELALNDFNVDFNDALEMKDKLFCYSIK